MVMSDSKKKELIIKNFEVLKDNDDKDTLRNLASAIGKMFAIDKDVAIDMWKYILQRNQTHLQSNTDASNNLIWHTVYESKNAIGVGAIHAIILNDPFIKNCVFSYDIGCWNIMGGGYIPLTACDITKSLLKKGCFQDVNDCLEALYNNKYRKASWYEIMNFVLRDKIVNMDDNLYDLLDSWCDKVTSEQEKAKLSIQLMQYLE